jgi:hypothetical protein
MNIINKSLYRFIRSLKRSIWVLKDIFSEISEYRYNFAIKDISFKVAVNWVNSPNLFEKKHRNIFQWIECHYPEDIKKMEEAHLAYEPEPVKHIWVMWWQGLDNAPALVKKCVKILKEKSQGYTITLLDKDNYKDYVDIPSYITNKFEHGKISIANYSDVIRMALLYKYGGFWIDSTVLLLDGWDKDYYNLPFFSIKNHLTYIDGAVSKFRFSTFFMYSKKNNTFFQLIRDFLYDYWKRQNRTIDYMLIDYVMLLICHHNREFKEMLDQVPYTNENVHTLRNHMGEAYSPQRFAELTKDTQIFKLTYKDFLIPKVKGVKHTIMQYFLKEY